MLAQHGLVGQVDDALGRVLPRRGDHRRGGVGAGVLERHAVLGLTAQLLGAAEQERGHHQVVPPDGRDRSPHHRRVVLAVDQHERALRHGRPAAES